ncbi:MAG TPA: DUF4350 domain-containing protein [Acidimicrobiales bacterium]|nr:DUF4350 domain-containing protein [Acidimicrobiales bacterium]
MTAAVERVRALPLGARVGIGLVAAVVAVNLLFAGVRTVVGGGRPGGPPSSSYATAEHGLAAYADLLADQGRRVTRLRVPLDEARLDPAETLVLADPDDLDVAEADAVAAFVASGGRLVAAGARAGPVLRRLLGGDLAWTSAGARTARPIVPVPETAGTTEVRSSGRGSWRDAAAGLPVLVGDGRVLGVVADVDRGRVVALADASPLHNRLLDDAGNAAFGLAAAGEQGRPVRFAESVHGYGEAGGFAALPDRWVFAAFVLFLSVLTWMWSRGRRLGPPDEPERELPPPRRAYVDALAAALARTRQQPEERRW